MAYPSNQPGWFASTPQTSMPLPQRKAPVRIIVILLLLAAIIMAVIIATTLSRPRCLSVTDYKTLTGVTHAGDLRSSAVFYTTPVTFQPDGSLTTASSDGLGTLGSFVKNHPEISTQLTIESSFSYPSAESSAKDNATAIKQALHREGVPVEIITIKQLGYIPAESPVPTTAQQSVSLTSAQQCR